ncbi:MAG: hypothetical protein GY941_27725, partial [Planctomycetes bacterium]|nr:hypothetical protein [Planctomycetota bacterium]
NVYYHEGERPLSPEQKSGFPDDDWPEASKELFLMLCAQQVESEYARVIIVEMLSELNSESLENMIVQREKIREIITRKIKISYPKPLNERTNNPMVFIGASGIGKTTAMSKLAREARLYSGNEILLISIENDCVEKLNSIAREIGAAVAVVANPEELRTVHDEFKNSAHVFVETTVTRGNDNGKFQELMEYMKVIPDFESNLVLDATTRLKDISNIIAERKRVPVHGLLFTKIDEADTFGALLNVAMKSGIPVSYIAKGNRLSGGIKPATANMIAELIFNS